MSEATMCLMDNSEHTRCGDYIPTRFAAQADAVNLLAGAKTQSHPENTVGVLTMAGKTPQVSPWQWGQGGHGWAWVGRRLLLFTLLWHDIEHGHGTLQAWLLKLISCSHVQVLVTPTPDLGKILNCMQEMEIEGCSNFTAAVQIAQLALKHRQNKNQRQRIVIFVASPIKEDKVWLHLRWMCVDRGYAISGRASVCGTMERCPY